MSAPESQQVQPVATRTPPAGRQFPCPKCAARLDFDPAARTLHCPYCNYQATILPCGLLPFAVTERQAISAFDGWIAGRWFAPTGLRQFANLGKLTGAYVPYWTFDSMTYTHYTGQRGDDYTVTETYTDTET